MNLIEQLYAQALVCGTGANNINIPGCGKNADQSLVANIISIVSGVAGAVCLLIIVIAGLRYVISNGNPESITKSKNAIIYAAIGLVVSLSAYMIVRFVVSAI